MQFRQFWSALAVSTAAAALAACAGSSTAPSATNALGSQVSADAAASTGQAAVSDIDETGNDNTAGSYSMVGGHGISAQSLHALSIGGCAQSGGEGDLRWYCGADTITISSDVMTDTLIRMRNYEFFAAGVAQSQITESTDSINWGGANGIPVYVAVHRARWHGVSHRIRNHSVTDDTPSFEDDSVRTWNGNTVANDTSAFTGTLWSVNYTGLAYDTTANVVFIHPRLTHPFPISGQFRRWATWTYAATGPSAISGSVSRHIVVTYDGTATATLQVVGTTTLTCSLDLITGNVTGCH